MAGTPALPRSGICLLPGWRGIEHERMDRPTRRDFKRATGDRYPDDVWKIVIGSTSDEEGNGTGFSMGFVRPGSTGSRTRSQCRRSRRPIDVRLVLS